MPGVPQTAWEFYIGGYQPAQKWLKDRKHRELTEEDWVDVFGIDPKAPESTEEINNTLGLDFSKWEEWLGMDVEEKTLKQFTTPEIIAHCMYEMTFWGYDQETIQQELNELIRASEEIDNMTEEERKTNLKSWDQVKKELGIEDDEEDNN